MALFQDPQAVAIAEAQQRAQQDPRAALRGSLFNLGNAGGGAITRGFGGDSRSPAQQRAAGLQGLTKGIDFKDPNSIQEGMNRLNEGGFQAEALKLLDALPTASKPVKRVVDEWIQQEQVGDTTKKFLFQRDNNGFITKAGEVSDKASADSPGSLFKFDSAFQSDVNFDEDSRGSFLGRLANRPEFKSLVDDTDPESLAQFSGLIQKVANDIKDNHRDAIGSAFQNNGLTAQQANLETARSDDFYLNEAYKRFVEGGGIEANIDRGFDLVGGAGVNLNPNQDTTDSRTLAGNQAQAAAKRDAISDVAARVDQLVVADPATGDFRLNKMTPQQATEVFSRMDGKSDQQIQQELEGQGFSFNDNLFQSHAQRWQLMRENPVAVAKFLSLNSNEDLREAEITRHLNELDENNNFANFASSTEVFKYLRRLAVPTKERRTTRFKN